MPGLGMAITSMPSPPQQNEYLQVNVSNATHCPIVVKVTIYDHPTEGENTVLDHECDCPATNCQHGFFIPDGTMGKLLSVRADAGNPSQEFVSIPQRTIV